MHMQRICVTQHYNNTSVLAYFIITKFTVISIIIENASKKYDNRKTDHTLFTRKKTNISITVTSKHKKVNIIYKLAQRSAKQLVTNSVYEMKHIGNKSELK